VTNGELKLQYVEVDISTLINEWVKGYGDKVQSHEYFIDTSKKTAILKLYISEQNPLIHNGLEGERKWEGGRINPGRIKSIE
jgi:hypothetical protein